MTPEFSSATFPSARMQSLARPYICARCTSKLKRTPLNRASRAFSNTTQRHNLPHISQDGRPFRLAVIGSGPAGFYTAYKVMNKIENSVVDMYESLPVPYGLVRFGVAPDHPEVKNCQDKFMEVAESPNFNFIGNVSIGSGNGSIPLTTLLPHYDAFLFAYGASKDKQLRIPGENTLNGIYSARAFVGWYNGLPEYAGLGETMDLNGPEVIVLGQGNVALDVARILLSPLDILRHTDITEEAIERLSRSKVKSVRVVGRRGALQAAFTIKEVRELMKLDSVAFSPIDTTVLPPNLKEIDRPRRRIAELLVKGSPSTQQQAQKQWSLDFRLSPKSFNSRELSPGQLSGLTFEKTTLLPSPFDLSARAINTSETVDLPAQLAFRSIGYKSESLPGLQDIGVPFDDSKGIIPSDLQGRVIAPGKGPAGTSLHIPGMYCAGWVKRGPTGVIASTMNDAFGTADVIAEDWHSHAKFIAGEGQPRSGWDGLKAQAEALGARRVSWADWLKIDAAERKRGKAKGKEREKFTSIKDMLAVLD